MRNNQHLNLIYNYLPAYNQQSHGSFYRILKFFNESGEVSHKLMHDIYAQFPQVGPEDWICFEDLDNLGRFAVQICVELEAPEVFILSSNDYNLGLESGTDVKSFKEIFRRYGTSIENPEGAGKRKNLFSKMFN